MKTDMFPEFQGFDKPTKPEKAAMVCLAIYTVAVCLIHCITP